MSEAAIEKHLRTKVEQAGGICWKFTSPGRSGVPDRIVIYKGRTIFVELKAAKGVVSKIQQVRHQQIRSSGGTVFVLSSRDEVNTFIREELGVE